MKNSSCTIGNRTRDLLTYSSVPQPTALPRATAADSSQMNFATQSSGIKVGSLTAASVVGVRVEDGVRARS
jgi:hypothetical protein